MHERSGDVGWFGARTECWASFHGLDRFSGRPCQKNCFHPTFRTHPLSEETTRWLWTDDDRLLCPVGETGRTTVDPVGCRTSLGVCWVARECQGIPFSPILFRDGLISILIKQILGIVRNDLNTRPEFSVLNCTIFKYPKWRKSPTWITRFVGPNFDR